MWTRDKHHLARAGIALSTDGARQYRRDDPPPLPRSALRAAGLVARVRALPMDGDPALETGLRKLAVLGAPILGALMERTARHGPGPRGKATEHAVTAGFLLLAALDAAGEPGLPLAEAAAVCGADDEAELRRLVGLLLAVDLPFAPPYDALPVELDGGLVRLYMRTAAVVAPALTGAERAALDRAGVLPAPAREAGGARLAA